MKIVSVILFGLSLVLLSFQKGKDVGKELFDGHCRSCHLPNKTTFTAPSFQYIRHDYGLQWTLAFLKNSKDLKMQKDVQALYSYYLFGRHDHMMFPFLEQKFVVKILDYVDKFPVDTTQWKHRLIETLKRSNT